MPSGGSGGGGDQLIGFLALFVSCIAFGFQFAPLKRLDTKDGVFVQWVQCSVVFMAGLITNIARGLPPFNLIAAIGGFLYATGNVASVPIVAEMGIGLGMLLWGSVQIIVGWSVARFGLFGTRAQHVHAPLLNYAGVVLTLLSGLIFVFVYSRRDDQEVAKKPKQQGKDKMDNGETTTNSTRLETGGIRRSPPPYGSVSNVSNTTTTNVWAVDVVGDADGATQSEHGQGPARAEMIEEHSVLKGSSPLFLSSRKIFFIGLALGLGCLHGLMLTPIVYVQDTDPNASDNVLDYVFSHFCAVYFFSTVYFVLYSLIMRGRPYVNAKLVLPSVAYGLLWTLGMTLFIMSNRLLSQTVSFPITVRLPAIIGALADVFLFKDIRGRRRLAYLFGAILIGSIGVILVGISL